jgi:hypothetical protein
MNGPPAGKRNRCDRGLVDLGTGGENPRLFIELFTVASGEEHLRQHRERQAGSDLQDRDDAAALSDPPPQTDHYLATDINE